MKKMHAHAPAAKIDPGISRGVNRNEKSLPKKKGQPQKVWQGSITSKAHTFQGAQQAGIPIHLITPEQVPQFFTGRNIWQKTAWPRNKKAPNNMEVAYQRKQIVSEGVGPPWIGEEGREA